jgi:uncharacterized membrane protein
MVSLVGTRTSTNMQLGGCVCDRLLTSFLLDDL